MPKTRYRTQPVPGTALLDSSSNLIICTCKQRMYVTKISDDFGEIICGNCGTEWEFRIQAVVKRTENQINKDLGY